MALEPCNDDAAQPGLSLGGLSTLLGFHLRLASVAMHRGFASEVGLTEKQFATLNLISANPGVSQAAIAARMGTDRATMMAIVRRLERRGLVLRRRSAKDGRCHALLLSQRGTDTLRHVLLLVTEHDRTFTSRFSKAEFRSLIEALARIHRHPGAIS
jgi:DNA-binding MarR family transcriptional regulator